MSKKQTAKAKKTSVRAAAKQQKSQSGVATGVSAVAQANDEVLDDDDAPTLDIDVTRDTLEATPVRVLTFLRAVGTTAAIRVALSSRGYRQADHLEGWAHLHAVSGYQQQEPLPDDTSVRDAISAIDAWDEGAFHVIAASLRYRFAEQAAFVLNGIGPSTGASAVLGVQTLLDRLDALESGVDREATQQKDQAAIALLAERGIDAKERQRLRDLIAVAQSAPELTLPSADSLAQSEAKYLQNLMQLRAWFDEWSAIARVAIRRRDYLIRLGLARRHNKQAEPVSPTPQSPTPANA